VSCSFKDYFGITKEHVLEDVSIEPILALHLAKKTTSTTTITITTTTTIITSTPSTLEQPSSFPNPPTLENIDLELALLNHMELLVVSKINRRKMVIAIIMK
jgi:hypothetical protein